MITAFIKRILSHLKYTPLHPQWLALRHDQKMLAQVAQEAYGAVLDIGCGDQRVRNYLKPGCSYIGLDYYPTAVDWYCSRPAVYADIQSLPLRDVSVDCVLLLDVLEHVPAPERSMREIYRVLRPGGRLILQVPFMYPLHDAPLDFHRWTRYGLYNLSDSCGFTVIKDEYFGQPAESAGLLLNLALGKTILTCLQKYHPGAVLIILAPFIVPVINICAWLLARLTPDDEMMASGLRLILVRNVAD